MPFFRSPLVSTMPYLTHKKLSEDEPLPKLPEDPIVDSSSSLVPGTTFRTPNERRSYFSKAPHREETKITPSDLITTDFCYGFLSFPEVYLQLPGGLSIDMMRYWDGQPVRFVCCERSKERNSHGYEGKSYWLVVIEVVESDFDKAEVESRTPEIDSDVD